MVGKDACEPSYLAQLQLLVKKIPQEYQDLINNGELLQQLAASLTDGTVFDIIKGLQVHGKWRKYLWNSREGVPTQNFEERKYAHNHNLT